MGLGKQLEKTKAQVNLNIKFAKGYENLNEIIKVQHSPLIKTGLGYNASQNDEALGSMPCSEACTKNYANAIKGRNYQDSKVQQQEEGSSHTQVRKPRTKGHSIHNQMPKYSRRYSTPGYSYFNDQCFTCHNFRHKAIHCVAYKIVMIREARNQNHERK